MLRKIKELYGNMTIQSKATLWFVVSSLILKGISFISAPLFTRLLSVEEYGIQSVYYSYQQIFLVLATFELTGGAFVRGLLDFKNEEIIFRKTIIFLSNVITLTLFGVVLLFQNYVVQLIEVDFEVICALFIYLLFYPAMHSWMMEKRFRYDYKKVVCLNIILAFVSTSVSVMGVVCFQNTARMKIMSALLVEIFFLALFYLMANPIKGLIKEKEKVKHMIGYALKFQLPLVFHSLSYLLLAQADRIMIKNMQGNYQAALYSVAYSVAIVISVVQIAIRDAYSPLRLQSLDVSDYRTIKDTTNRITILMALLVVLFCLIMPDFYRILFPMDYQPGIYLIPSIAISMFFMALYGIFVDIEAYYHKTQYVAIASLVAAGLNIVLNYIGIIIWGYQACAYTTLFSYIVMAGMHYAFSYSLLKKHSICVTEVFDTKKVFILSCALIGIMVVLIFLIPYVFLRYSLVLCSIICMIIVFRRKKRQIIDNRVGS